MHAEPALFAALDAGADAAPAAGVSNRLLSRRATAGPPGNGLLSGSRA